MCECVCSPLSLMMSVHPFVDVWSKRWKYGARKAICSTARAQRVSDLALLSV